MTVIYSALAVSVLGDLTLNALLGWWWADPLSALVIVYYRLREGTAAIAEATD